MSVLIKTTGGENEFGLAHSDLWYLGEGAGGAYSWKSWQENTTSTLGNDSGIQDPPQSAGLIMGPYDGPAYDYIIDTAIPPFDSTFPLWQFTWVIIENNSVDKMLLLDYVQVRSATTQNPALWNIATYPNRDKFQPYASCQILGKWAGCGTDAGHVRAADGLLDASTHSGTFPLGDVDTDGGGPNNIVFCASGNTASTNYYYPNGDALVGPSGVFNPWQVVRAHDSYSNAANDKYKIVLSPDEAAVGVIAVSMDQASSTVGTAAINMATGVITQSGWGINGSRIRFRWYET